MKVQMQDFLTDEQKKSLQTQVVRLKQKIGKLPIKTTSILHHYIQFKSPILLQLKEIDPQNSIFMKKILELNQKYMYKQFQMIVNQIINLFIQQTNRINQGQSLKNLEQDIQIIVNTNCQTKNQQFHIDNGLPDEIDEKTWNIFYEQLIVILTKIIGFMHKIYEMEMNKLMRQHAITIGMQNIRNAIFDKSNKRIQGSVKLEQSMIKIKNKSYQYGDFQENEEQRKIFQFVDNVQKQAEKQQQNQIYQSYEVQLNRRNSQKKSAPQKAKSVFSSIKQKSTKIFKKVHNFVNKTNPYEQKQINQMVQSEQIQQFLQNLQYHPYFQLKPQQIEQITKISHINNLQELKNRLHSAFETTQIAVFKFCIDNVVHQWIQNQKIYPQQSVLYQKCLIFLLDYAQKLNKALQQIKIGDRLIYNSNNRYFLLVKYFLTVFEEIYVPLTKRYLMNVICKIQNQLHLKQKMYLRGALRIYQQKFIRPSKLASLLANQKPLRSPNFQQSHLSKLYIQHSKFQDQTNVNKEFQKELKHIQIDNKLQDYPIIELARLGCASQTKNITILVSGFLSENSSKDLQWMGLIRALRDTELYCLGWKSSTLKQLTECLANMGKDIVLNPINLSGSPLWMIANVARYAYQMYGQYKNNPFSQACNRAQLTGIYLAQLLTSQFSDRFVSLVGFSLGSQVVTACTNRLIQKNKLGLINRIVTLGGVADQSKVQNVLKKSNIGINWINIWSKKDISVRFLYRLTNFSQTPIGSSNFQGYSGHEFKCLQSNFVSGHMDFRSHLYGFGLLTGIIHD